jgi:hypothetical protein
MSGVAIYVGRCGGNFPAQGVGGAAVLVVALGLQAQCVLENDAVVPARYLRRRMHACHMRRRIHAYIYIYV